MPGVEQKPPEAILTNAVPRKSGSVIIFDPVTGQITTEKAKKLEFARATSQKTAPKWGHRVKIYDKPGSELLIASLNLDKLGWSAKMKRLCGKCNEVYVMELPDGPESTIAVAA